MKYLSGFCLLLFVGCATTTSPVTTEQAQTPVPAAAQAAAVQQAVQKQEADIVKIKIQTNVGDIYAELFAKEAPKTVENFVSLAKKGYYDGIIFHRVIPNFMIQTGDPTGTGTGGPGYQFADEFSENLRHDKAGILSMANSGPNTNGSQFFITVAPTPWLDGKHSIFGKVTEGTEVAIKIANAPRNSRDKPLEEIKMVKVEVVA